MRTLNLNLASLSLALGVLLLAGSACGESSEPVGAEETLSPATESGTIDVEVGGEPLTTFYFGPETAKPYLHPLRAADGTVVTRSYPMSEDVAGEAHDHPHHRGMWFSHGDVNGIDFWGNEPSQASGNRGVITALSVVQDEDQTIRGEFEWSGPDGEDSETILTEKRVMSFRGDAETRVLDFDIELTAGEKPVRFGDTKEGTFAVRIAHSMREERPDDSPGEGVILNSEGKRGEAETWGKAAPWVDYSGPIGEKTYGIAIFDHPSNPKHPTFWHVRAYGLFAANIFGEHHFFADEERDGSVTLAPGESLSFRYRVIIHSGDAAAADVAALYKAWAE